MPPRAAEAAGGEPMRLNSAARLLGYDRRTLLKYRDLLGIYRLGREWRVPATAITAIRDGALTTDATH